MDSIMDIVPGTFVISLAGRDKGRVFIVSEIASDNYVKIIDGELRTVQKPKLKKIKHLNISKKIDENIAKKLREGANLTDVNFRKAISEFVYNNKDITGEK